MLGPIRDPKIISINVENTSAVIHLSVPEELAYLEGHFSGHPIVPGIVQLHWVVNLSKEIWGITGEIEEVSQIKFSKLMRPLEGFDLKIEHNFKDSLIKYSYKNNENQYSSGRFKYVSKYKLCALLPTHNHGSELKRIVDKLLSHGLEVIIVNDGSNQSTRNIIDEIKANNTLVEVLHNTTNEGKGSAVKKGLRFSKKKGYTHVFQIDADGQHDLDNLNDFIRLSMTHPSALISGHPIYDKSIPLSRKIGRMLTHVWVWIETLSFNISDSMCGFRIYPLMETVSTLEKQKIGCRMDFDTEIMVHLYWNKVPIIMNPVKVTYPTGNLSNFDVLKDNWRITKMHFRLFFGMLTRIKAKHWASLEERGTLLGLRILSECYRLLGRTLCQWIGVLIVLYFYVTGKQQRSASYQYLEHVFKCNQQRRRPKFKDSFYHFMSFFNMALDKFSAWAGHLNEQQMDVLDIAKLDAVFSGGKGGLLLVSHFGNMDFCRAFHGLSGHPKIHVLMHIKNSKKFNTLMNTIHPNYKVNIIEVTEVGLETILQLREYIEKGEWIIIAADRVPINDRTRVCSVSFLGEDALFAEGPYILAHLLECPVYAAFAPLHNNRYQVFIECFSEKIVLESGANRNLQLKEWAQKYAQLLESYCLKYPYQWFNFYNYWNKNLEKT